ncbi:MAG TPA: hypothetical protein VMZ91_03610 [Candidatus Paceibacterota bacterium]|nr:hypothetical protein [Candidatus Paceibacterota bacterium]
MKKRHNEIPKFDQKQEIIIKNAIKSLKKHLKYGILTEDNIEEIIREELVLPLEVYAEVRMEAVRDIMSKKLVETLENINNHLTEVLNFNVITHADKTDENN